MFLIMPELNLNFILSFSRNLGEKTTKLCWVTPLPFAVVISSFFNFYFILPDKRKLTVA